MNLHAKLTVPANVAEVVVVARGGEGEGGRALDVGLDGVVGVAVVVVFSAHPKNVVVTRAVHEY